MYEPIYPPKMEQRLAFVPIIPYAVRHQREFVDANDPSLEPLHIHPHMELLYNVSGNLSFLIDGKVYDVRPGEAVISKAGAPHVCIFRESRVQEWFCFWVDDRMDCELFTFLHKEHFYPVLSLNSNQQARLVSLLTQLRYCTEERKTPLQQTSRVLQVLALLEEVDPNVSARADIPEALQRILEDINQNFASIHSQEDLLKRHFVSAATMNRWFRQYLHLSFRRYLIFQKLSQAAKLLSDGATVTEACMSVGFSDSSYFISLFKKQFGITPLQYKKEQKRGPSSTYGSVV